MRNESFALPSGLSPALSRAGETGPQTLLIHGWTCRKSDWHPTMTALQDDFRLTAIDLPGHGESHQQSVDPWTIKSLADVVVEAVQAMSEPDIILVGHSMGGVVALEAARQLDNVRSVVLVDTFVISYGDLNEDQAQKAAQPFYDDFPGAIAGLVDNFTGSGAAEQDKDRLKAEMGAGDPTRMLPLWSDLLRWTPAAAFAEIKAPIHAINGDLVPEAARARCSNHVTEHRLEGAGHFPQVEMPDRFHQCLREVLKTVS